MSILLTGFNVFDREHGQKNITCFVNQQSVTITPVRTPGNDFYIYSIFGCYSEPKHCLQGNLWNNSINPYFTPYRAYIPECREPWQSWTSWAPQGDLAWLREERTSSQCKYVDQTQMVRRCVVDAWPSPQLWTYTSEWAVSETICRFTTLPTQQGLTSHVCCDTLCTSWDQTFLDPPNTRGPFESEHWEMRPQHL